MLERTLIWNTDTNLRITSLSARLRDFAGIGSRGVGSTFYASDLWGETDPHSLAVVAHYWALAGESVGFDVCINGETLRFQLEPLTACDGSVAGVTGTAIPHLASNGLNEEAIAFGERTAGVGTWYEDVRTGRVSISEGLATLLGVGTGVSVLDIRAFDHPDDRATVAAEIRGLLQDGLHYSHDHRIMRFDSQIRNVRERVRTLVDERGVAYARIGTLVDITDFKEREALLEELAHHDPLTRLPNRAMLEERLTAAIGRARRNDSHCAVLFIDLDHFKEVNDRFGHAAGDAVLARVGDRLLRNVRGSDLVARLGGDEFVILLEDLYSSEAAVDAARKLLRSFDEPLELDGIAVRVGASIGVASYPGADATAQAMLAAADREMYVIKQNGGYGVKLAQKETPAREVQMVTCDNPAKPSKGSRRYARAASA